MTLAAEIAWAIALNERFQVIALSAAHSTDVLRDVVESALPHLVGRGPTMTAEVMFVDTWHETVQHALSAAATLTVYDAFSRNTTEVDAFMNGLNAHRDTMGSTSSPSTLLLHFPTAVAGLVYRYQDIMSCAQLYRLP